MPLILAARELWAMCYGTSYVTIGRVWGWSKPPVWLN